VKLIDADALLEAMRKEDVLKVYECIKLVKNAPTVQREGWVSVENLQRLYDDMFRHKDISISANSLFKLINHE